MEKHYLKPKQYYIDRYDRMTVERCREFEKAIAPSDVKRHLKKKVSKQQLEYTSKTFNEVHLWFLKGELYIKKEEIISRWIREDEERDRFYENTKALQNISCLTCGREMEVSFKDLETSLDKQNRILFMYDCPSGHLPRRAFYDNGEEWKYEKPLCFKCGGLIEQIDKDTKKAFKTISTCLKCGDMTVSEIPRTVGKEKEDLDFEKDRERFCSEKDGREYVSWMNTAKEIDVYFKKEEEKKENKELYDRVAKLKKLSIPQLKQYVTEIFKDESYTNLIFEQPSIEKVVSIGFTIEDPTDQSEYDSKRKLTKLFKKVLEETNWRLMSDGISYRLGVLMGRMRVYENEEELVKLLDKG